MIEIRELSVDDIPRAYVLAKEIFGADVEDDRHDEVAWRANFSHGGLLLGAFDGEAMVGFKFGYRREEGALHSWLGGVSASHRGQGIAKRLMEAQERIARERGYRSITVSTLRSRFSAMYAALKAGGYLLVGEEPRSDGDTKASFIKHL